MFNFVRKLGKDEDGAAMVEYAVLLGIITAASLTILATLGGQVTTIFTNISTALATAIAG